MEINKFLIGLNLKPSKENFKYIKYILENKELLYFDIEIQEVAKHFKVNKNQIIKSIKLLWKNNKKFLNNINRKAKCEISNYKDLLYVLQVLYYEKR